MNNYKFLGRLTKEVETRQTQNGGAVASFSIAVNRRYAKDSEIKADFFNITAFGKTAEFCSKYFKKGKQVLISGRIQNRTWEDEKGQKRYATDYIAEEVYFADSSNKNENNIENDFVEVDSSVELPF